MNTIENLELGRRLINLLIICLGALAIGFVLRTFLKIAWNVIKFVVVILIIIFLMGGIFGWFHLPTL